MVEEAGTDPATTSQAGRRAYAGRTALHWAARNGHVHVMEYLVISRGVDVDARTAEGTTAFAWACWRGRVDAMRWLVEKGECRFGAVNTFGCNAAMWVVQGGAGLDACRYVRSLGVTFRLLNANGHSAVHKAAQRGRRDVCAWLLGRGGDDDGDDGDADAIVESDAPESDAEAAWARALVGSAHLAPDNEGFTPADHARLAGDARLATWLRARQREASVRERTRFIRNDGRNDGQNDETLAAVADESRGNDSVDRRVRDASGVETTYPPATFYGAAAVGDVHLLEEILDTDPYHVNQDNGTGAPLHFAVTYGRVDAVRELLAGGTRAAVNVNQRSKAGGFGLTPLHLAATLFRKRRVAAAARADLAAAEAELASEASVDLTGAKEEVIKAFTKEEAKAAKAAEKAARKAAHQRAAAARKVLATHGCRGRGGEANVPTAASVRRGPARRRDRARPRRLHRPRRPRGPGRRRRRRRGRDRRSRVGGDGVGSGAVSEGGRGRLERGPGQARRAFERGVRRGLFTGVAPEEYERRRGRGGWSR